MRHYNNRNNNKNNYNNRSRVFMRVDVPGIYCGPLEKKIKTKQKKENNVREKIRR